MPLLSTFGAASARGFGNLSGIEIPVDDLFNTVSFLSHFDGSNNGTNNVFDDSSTSNHTITANGNVTQGSFGPFARPDGEWGVAFDGSDGLSSSASTDYEFGTGDLTVEYWAFPTASGAIQNIVDNRAEASGWKLGRDASNRFQVYNEVTSSYLFESDTFPEGEWSHFCWTRASGVNKFFINGVQSGSNVSDSSNFNSNSLNIGVQHAGDTQFFTGTIASVRVIKGTAVEPSGLPTSPPTAVTNTKLLTCQSNRFVDNSTSDHTITTIGNPAVSAFGPFLTSSVYSAGVNGASAYFDGTGDYLDVDNSSELVLGTDDFTIEAWAYPTTYNTGNANVIMQRVNGGSNNGWLFGISSGGLWQFSTGAAVIKRSTASAGMNEWTHLAAVRNGSSYNFFVNGVSVGTSTTMYNFTDTTTFQVGWQGSFAEFTGYVCDARVIKGTAIYTSNFTPPTAPLTAVTNTKLLLNMADGQAIDSAAQNNLTLYGDAKISSTQSKFGGTSLALDGTGDYATLPPNSLDLGAGNFTLESWVYTTVTGQRCVVGAARNSDGNGSYMLNINYTGAQVRFFCRYNGGTVLDYTVGSGDFPTNAWTHLAATRDGANLRVFIGGTQVGTTNTTLGSFAIDNASLNGNIYYIGRTTDGANEFTGFLDDLRVSKTARYTANFTPPTEPFANKGQ